MTDRHSPLEQLLDHIYAAEADDIQCDEAEVQMVHAAQALLSNEESRQKYPMLWKHFQFCINCEEEYEALMEIATLEAEGQLDHTSNESTRPSVRRESSLVLQTIKDAMEQGQEWVRDGLGSISIPLGLGLQTQAVTLVTKSKSDVDADGLLYQKTIDEKIDGAEWQIVVSAFAESDARCRVDVSLFNLDEPTAELEPMLITLHINDILESTETDTDGLATFGNVPRERLDQVMVTIRSDK